MPSPFPGMAPWLEHPAVFPDLHNRLASHLSDTLNELLPAPYFSALATRIYVENERPLYEPDVDILRSNSVPASLAENNQGGLAMVSEVQPVCFPYERPEQTEWFVNVYSAPGDEHLVTSIEILSPSNKRSGSLGRQQYRDKQAELLARAVHLVEIDLLCGGTHTTTVAWHRLRAHPGGYHYHVCVHRYDRPTQVLVYPILLPQRLPIIDIPIGPPVDVLKIDLQNLLDTCYRVGRYERRVRYDRPAEPIIPPEWQPWVEVRLTAQRGTR